MLRMENSDRLGRLVKTSVAESANGIEIGRMHSPSPGLTETSQSGGITPAISNMIILPMTVRKIVHVDMDGAP